MEILISSIYHLLILLTIGLDFPAYGSPVLISGDIFAAFNDRPEARRVMKFFATVESTKEWVKAGGFISPHKDIDLGWYPNYNDSKIGEILLNATTVRFDASDLMPGTVGTGTFWSGMIDYIEGVDLETVMIEIDNSW